VVVWKIGAISDPVSGSDGWPAWIVFVANFIFVLLSLSLISFSDPV